MVPPDATQALATTCLGKKKTPTLIGLIGLVGIAMVCGGSPALADDLKSIVRTLNAIVNPEDAWRLEDQPRRYRHRDEEHYWHNYAPGLEQQRRERGEGGPQYGGPGRYMSPIGPDETYRLQDQAGSLWAR